MSDEMNDPLSERLGPILLRLMAWLSVAVIATPVALLMLVPFVG